MLTVFLWILLIAATVTLIVIASPIRIGGSAGFSRSGGEYEYSFEGSYIHPLIFKAVYSSKNEHPRVSFLGFTVWPRKKKKKNTDDDTNANIETDRYNDTVDATDSRNTPPDANQDSARDAHPAHIPQPPEDTNAGGTDEHPKTPETPKKKSLRVRIKKRIDIIRKHTVYRLLSDKPMQKKMRRQVTRLLAGILKLISIDSFKLRTKLGYRDPAALGRIYGYFIAARAALELQNRSVDISMEPVFTEECFEIEGALALKTTLSTLTQQCIIILLAYWKIRKIMENE